jgi:AcrR family transcriptional regulator
MTTPQTNPPQTNLPQTHERALRSDAAANRERVLAAAAVAVRRDGERVAMATIAEEAGVGVGTVYRHYPTRTALLAALSLRSYRLVLDHARTAANADRPAIDAIAGFWAQTIAARDDLILPLHGGPVTLDAQTLALRAEIRDLLEQVLTRGRRDGSIRDDATATDIIITGAMLAQPLAHVTDWDRLARRQAEIYIAGLAPTRSTPPARRRTSRAARSS